MPENVNSAYRIREILNMGRSKSDSAKSHDIWAQIFRIKETDSNKKNFEIARCLNQMHEEIENIMNGMRRTDFSEHLYSNQIKRIYNVIAVQTIMNDWKSQKAQITGEMILVLGFCSEISPNEEFLIDENDFEAILDCIVKLEEKLEENNLPFELQKITQKHIQKVKEAISSYQIVGAQAISDVTISAYGEVIANETLFEEAKGTEEIGLLSKMWKSLKNISDKIVSTDKRITAGANVVERGVKLLGKRQGNHIFFLARGCVKMRQPQTIKEDAHDKVTDRPIPSVQYPATLEGPCRDLAEEWTEPSGILPTV